MDHFIGSETTISACNWGNILSVSKSAALEILNFHVFHEIIFYNHESALILIEDNWDKKIESREVWGSCSEYSLSFSANQTLVLMIEETKSPIGWRSERFSATTQIFLWGAQMHFSCFLSPKRLSLLHWSGISRTRAKFCYLSHWDKPSYNGKSNMLWRRSLQYDNLLRSHTGGREKGEEKLLLQFSDCFFVNARSQEPRRLHFTCDLLMA